MSFLSSRYIALLVVLTATHAQANWNRALADTTPGRPVVVELFTSQGCSSCPPADSLLGELAAKSNVIALGFHVDYWDGIGWRDRYSMPQATERQRRYVEALNLTSAFTPQMVINGRHSIVGSDRARIAAAMEEPPPSVPVDATVDQDQIVITLPDGSDHRRCDVSLVAYLRQTTTRVGGGENSGRTLTEFNVVRQFRQIGTWDGKATLFHIPLNSLPSEASHVAVLIQHENLGQIAGAVALSLR